VERGKEKKASGWGRGKGSYILVETEWEGEYPVPAWTGVAAEAKSGLARVIHGKRVGS